MEFNNSLNLYLLDVNRNQLYEWLVENFPDLDEFGIWQGRYNTSVFEAYLQAYPESIMLEETVKGVWTRDFLPTKIVNVTVVLSNPSPNPVEGDITLKEITTLVARERVLIPARWLLLIGLVLALPWSYMRIKKTPMS